MQSNRYPTNHGYLTEKIRGQYISKAIEDRRLPDSAHRMADLLSLDASDDTTKPIQFWQLYSVLGQDRIVNIVHEFYKRVFADEDWFKRVFAQVGGIAHHVNTQASMWIDVMGGGSYYHGGEYRLSFHHTHNAMALMNDEGAARWVKLMKETLDDPIIDMTDDPRVRPAINTFLSYFMSKYAAEFKFADIYSFGDSVSVYKRSINFLNMTSDAIEALPETELIRGLEQRGVDVSQLQNRDDMINAALRL